MGTSVRRIVAAAAVALGAGLLAAGDPFPGTAEARDAKAELQKGLDDFDLAGDWIYDDIGAGFARAARERKPVCIVFR